jgi:hypothetical protein
MSRRLFGRRFAHSSAALTVAGMSLLLAGFVRISFQPGGPGFQWSTDTLTFVVQEDGSADVDDASDRSAVRLGFRAWQDLPASSSGRMGRDLTSECSCQRREAGDITFPISDENRLFALVASVGKISRSAIPPRQFMY